MSSISSNPLTKRIRFNLNPQAFHSRINSYISWIIVMRIFNQITLTIWKCFRNLRVLWLNKTIVFLYFVHFPTVCWDVFCNCVYVINTFHSFINPSPPLLWHAWRERAYLWQGQLHSENEANKTLHFLEIKRRGERIKMATWSVPQLKQGGYTLPCSAVVGWKGKCIFLLRGNSECNEIHASRIHVYSNFAGKPSSFS